MSYDFVCLYFKALELSKIILQGYILVPNADLEAVKSELPNHIQLTRQEAGCLVFEVSQDNENINRFNVYEEFVSENAFKLHQQRLSDTQWAKISSGLERHYEKRL